MAKEKGNSTVYWVMGTLVSIALVIGGYLATSIAAAGQEVITHEKLEGHPVMIERVNGISRKLEGIEDTQHEQSGMLRKILVEVEKG